MVIGPDLNLSLTARNVHWAKESILRLPTAIFKITLLYSIPGKSSIYPTDRARTPTRKLSLLTEHTGSTLLWFEKLQSVAPFQSWLVNSWPNRLHAQSLAGRTDNMK